ncbi:penicillin-binding protein activator LpoB [Aquimarina agarivorans]|uniref:penicillin-binding protein activator LpoB n=1 Tax=Aquimarina agarivorans TaxID=980584 RepID=UPI000248F582|nr:penicillin-binding protein activator LpoB [Aquimarina agarivorans]
MKKSIITLVAAAFSLSIITTSCSRKITRVATDTTIDLSGRWNDTDSRLAAEELSEEILTGDWITDFVQKNGKKPVMIVGLVRNKSHEHIESETFIKDIEKALIQKQKARVVQGGKMREELRAERADQQNNSSVSTMKKFGLETGADYMLQGNINSIVDAHKREKVVYYQIDLELTHLQTNEKVWIGDKKIKKFVKN